MVEGQGFARRDAAQQILAEKYGVASTVYSVTSYQMLRKDALECERHNRLHPEGEGKLPYVQKVLGNTRGPVIATSAPSAARARAEARPNPCDAAVTRATRPFSPRSMGPTLRKRRTGGYIQEATSSE